MIGYGGSGFPDRHGRLFFLFQKGAFKIDRRERAFRSLSTGEIFRIFASGFIINTLNPGVLIFWLGNASVLAFDTYVGANESLFSPFVY